MHASDEAYDLLQASTGVSISRASFVLNVAWCKRRARGYSGYTTLDLIEMETAMELELELESDVRT